MDKKSFEKVSKLIDKNNINIEHFHNAKVVESKYPELHWKGNARMSNLDETMSYVDPKGIFLEFGVYSGNTINFVADAFPKNTLYGFDSFEGLPEEWQLNEKKIIPKGYFHRDTLPKVRSNVKLIKGWFDQTIPTFLKEHNFDYISFLHIDCDLYSSTKTIFNNLNDKIQVGTVITFDELYPWTNYKWFRTWQEHEFKALKEWINEYNRSFKILNRSNHCQTSIIITS
jgi:hypothetical protein